jgi:RNA polymerase sigma-70 factor (ECF subfamily)
VTNSHHALIIEMPLEEARSEPTDYDLLRRAAHGDQEAFELVYRRYHRIVYRFARAMTGASDVAEDVTQDVFVALIGQLHRYDPTRAAFTTYLYGIARNVSLNKLRGLRRHRPLEKIRSRARYPDSAHDPLHRLEGDETAAQVRQALRALPTHYRELILLCDLHGLPYAEAAVVTGKSVGGVRAGLHRGRHLLRQLLRDLLKGATRRTQSDTDAV